jgi:23S rRNA (uracil1939-C5)-methyltransferase
MTKLPPAPIRKGQSLSLRCERMNADGSALAQSATGVQVSLTGPLPGDVVTAQIEHISPHRKGGVLRAWGHVVSEEKRGPHHVSPICPPFGACGGCTWQNMAYAEQLRSKTQFVVDAFAQHGVGAAVQLCVPSPVTDAYRNQAKYVVEFRGREVLLGGYAPRSHTVIDLVRCSLVEPAVRKVIERLKNELSKTRIVDLRYIVIRANAAGQTLLTLVLKNDQAAELPQTMALAHWLVQQDATLVGVVANINSDPGDVIFGSHDIVLAGNGTLPDTILGLDLQLSPRAFFQVNRHVAALAYSAIADVAASLQNVTCVWDVYAGVGTIARVVAARLPSVNRVFCVEIRATAVDDARAAWRDTSGAVFQAVAADAATAFGAQLPNPDIVVLNPPRAGCDVRVLQLVATRRPQGIAYLSCNPQTLARDLAVLSALGYKISNAVPYDMLPHTPHVETLVSLRRD